MKWYMKNKPSVFSRFEKKYGRTKAIALINANILNIKDANDYLNNIDLHESNIIPNLEEIISLIWGAIYNDEKICVFGDYDVDGITASAIMAQAIRRAGGDVIVRLPDRITEGYGISIKAIKEMLDKGVSLFVTVDNGIKAVNEIKYAKEHGASVVVLDHHIAGKELPNADFISDLHWNQGDYPFANLTGSGLAFKAACILLEETDPAFAESLIDLAAIGTIADVEILLGENRAIVKRAIQLMRSPSYNRIGIKLLFTGELSHITAEDIAFQIGPCLNAYGRLEINGAETPFNLLMSDDYNEAKMLSEKIKEKNAERKEIQAKCYAEILPKAKNSIKNGDKILVLFCQGAPSGIVGLLAGNLKEEFNRPAIVFAEKTDIKGNTVWTGSARSIPEYNILTGLDLCQYDLLGYGGHALAAGMSIEPNYEALEKLKKGLNEDAVNLRYSMLESKIYWIDEITEDVLRKGDIYKELDECEPFGEGNPKPIFKITFDTTARKSSLFEALGKEKSHLKLTADGFDALGFGMVEKYENMGNPKTIKALCSLTTNYYNGNSYKQIMLKDFQKVKPKETDLMSQLSSMLKF